MMHHAGFVAAVLEKIYVQVHVTDKCGRQNQGGGEPSPIFNSPDLGLNARGGDFHRGKLTASDSVLALFSPGFMFFVHNLF